ncbi:MAG TPA: hypothetical protein VK547_05715, partial [Candidatus Udaeobacter sp.]|nr:hypothetical protein [Candidatus Udaeobacter sp.]
MAEDAERPPHPRGRDQPAAAIGHHAVAGPDAERTHRASEIPRVRQHVRQRVRVIRDGLDVEEDRAGQVRL